MDTEECITCSVCGATETAATGWAGNAGCARACHRRGCLRTIGIKSAQLKRSHHTASAPAERAAATASQPPFGSTLVEVKAVLGQRYLDPDLVEDWQHSNDVAEEDEVIEYLAQATFRRNSKDKAGITIICWLTVHQMKAGEADYQSLKAAHNAYSKRCVAAVKKACRAFV